MNILDNGIEVQDGQFQYLWFRIVDDLGKHRYRAVALRELTALALDDKEIEDYNVWGKQWGAVQGLYNAGVDFVYTAAGIYTPDHVGVVQFYGAASDGDSIEDASRLALRNLNAVEAVLANQQQSK
ncbi:MAG: ATP-binding protein, partial [Chloroflexi bacterium]|nr:ATP-binding protein [Chloroflexota bacterium]